MSRLSREQLGADERRGLRFADVEVVAGLGLRRRREDRLRQPIRFDQAGAAAGCRRPRRSPCSPSSPSPTGSRARRTRSAAAWSCARASSGRRAASACGARRRRDTRATSVLSRVVGDDAARALEPERRELREHAALVGDARAEHVVERRDAIGGDDERVVVARRRGRGPCRAGRASGRRARFRAGAWSVREANRERHA